MKILHVVPDISRKVDSSVHVVRHMAQSMQRCGTQAEVLSLRISDPEWLSAWAVPVHQLKDTWTYYQYTSELVPWLRKRRQHYDAVIVHGVWRYPSVGVWRVLQGTSTPYFLFTHGMLDPWFEQAYPLKHVKKSLFWRFAEHRVLRDAKAVLFTSEQERALAGWSFRPYQCCEKVVGLGTPAPPADAETQRQSFLDRFPHLQGKRLILFLGRLHRKKGCDLLAHAFGAVASRDPNLHLVFAGPDEESLRRPLEEIAASLGVANRVTWTGHLDGHLKWGAFRTADTFVLPSHSENYGIALVEALACGVPVLITDKVNIWREIDADGAGLVASDDLAGIVALLQTWCALSVCERRCMSANAIQCFRDRFEIDRFTSRFLDYLASEVGIGTARAASTRG